MTLERSVEQVGREGLSMWRMFIEDFRRRRYPERGALSCFWKTTSALSWHGFVVLVSVTTVDVQ